MTDQPRAREDFDELLAEATERAGPRVEAIERAHAEGRLAELVRDFPSVREQWARIQATREVGEPLEPEQTVTDGWRQVQLYAVGLVCTSACAPKDCTPGDVEFAANYHHPTGISSQWTVADEPFATGQPNPCVCNDDPGRLHWLLTC